MPLFLYFCRCPLILCMKKLIRYNILIFATLLLMISSGVQKPDANLNMLDQMTLEEKIAQLLIIRVSSTENKQYNNELIEKIARIQPGGVCFFKGTPRKQALLTNRMQAWDRAKFGRKEIAEEILAELD